MLRILSLSHFLLLFLVAACVPAQTAKTPSLSGRTMYAGKPASGIRVMAWPVDSRELAGRAPFQSAPSASDGSFTLDLPAGRYFLLARGNGLFAWYGRNPVGLGNQPVAGLNIGLVPEHPPAKAPEPFVESGIQAVLMADGKPVEGATLYVYVDSTTQFKGMGYVMVGPSDAEGVVEATLPAGTYYLLARKRLDGAQVGPLHSGDFIGYFPGNPVRLQDSEVRRIVLPMLEVPEQSTRQTAAARGVARLSGTVRDDAGRPVAGVRVVLYRDAGMLNRPDLVSEPTGADGRWQLHPAETGTWYLAARNTLGGAPAPGDLYGTWNGRDDHAVQVRTGDDLGGLDIVVEEMW
ncbi:MAG: hypothetical protein D6740_12985 [Alphaproteobacteria bacterium]|nr:MAG: hypothetical protein D6740_12985 [Alphaproteobacteria bacterium]